MFIFEYWHTEKPFQCCAPGQGATVRQPRTSPSGRLSVLTLALAGDSVQGRHRKGALLGIYTTAKPSSRDEGGFVSITHDVFLPLNVCICDLYPFKFKSIS